MRWSIGEGTMVVTPWLMVMWVEICDLACGMAASLMIARQR